MPTHHLFDSAPDPSVATLTSAPAKERREPPVFALPSQLGNAGMARLLNRVPAAPTEDLDEDEQKRNKVQAKHDGSPEVGLDGGPVSSGLASRIDAARGGGSALPGGVRSNMEAAFGTSLQDVRLHTGSESDSLNKAVTAKAFTTGNDIFVRGDAYRPNSADGERLLAHELTHVVQQRSMDGSGPMTVGAADDHLEHEADGVASAVAQRVAGPEEDPDEPR